MRHRKPLLYLLLIAALLGSALPPAAQARPPKPLSPAGSGLFFHEGRAWEGAQTPTVPTPSPSRAPSDAEVHLESISEAYNGGRIAFASCRDDRHQIYAMEADGSNQVNLSANAYQDTGPVIGPDGRIAFISTRDGNQEIYVMDADGGNQRRLTNTAGKEGFIAWAPDGSRLGFDYKDPTTNRYQLVTINADGSAGRVVLLEDTQALAQPDWSPDGTEIAFYWDNWTYSPAQPGIYTIPAGGGEQPSYTEIGYQHPRWSPDGSKLAFVSFDQVFGTGAIGVMNADGTGEVTRLSPGEAKDNVPRWSPDGRRIIFHSNYMGYEQLYVTLADGSTSDNYLNLSASGATDGHPDWSPHGAAPPLSSGSHVAYQFAEFQNGSPTGLVHIYLYNEETEATTTAVEGQGLRLAGLFAHWLVYQQENACGGYDVWVYDIETGLNERISSVASAVKQNRPFIDGARVVWRRTSATWNTLSGRFYVHDLLDGTTASLNTGTHTHYYSRYTVGNGLLILIAGEYPSGSRQWVFDLNGNDYWPSAIPYDPVLLGGLSGNRVAALEHGSGGNDLLATYVLTPTARTEIGAGAAGMPQIEDEVLVWQQGSTIRRWDLREEEAAEEVAVGTAPSITAGKTVWLDGSGTWSPSQQTTLAYYAGWSGDGGDYEFEQPDSEDLVRSGATWSAGETWPANVVAKLQSGEAYRSFRNSSGEIWHYSNLAKQAGWRIKAGYHVHVPPEAAGATFVFRDGSTLRAGGGSFIFFRGFRPSSEGTIRRLIQDLEALQPNIVADLKAAFAKTEVEATRPPGKINLGKLSNYLNEIDLLSGKLASASAQRVNALCAADRGIPSYLYDINNLSAHTAGATARIGKTVGWIQVATSLFRLLNLHRYTNEMYQAFEEYLGSVGSAVWKDDGRIVFYPAGTQAPGYLNRVDILYKMVLDDGRICFQENNWKLTRYPNGTVRLESAGCGPITWSKFETAKHFVRVDREALRRSFLAPLLTNSLQWYESLAGLITPGEATLIYSALTKNCTPKHVTVERGSMRGSLQMGRAMKEKLPTLYSFPGVHVLIWSTAFEATVNADGSTTFLTTEGTPVVANLNADAPDAYGVTWRDGNLDLSAPPGQEALNIPTRVDDMRPRLLELFPNAASAVAQEDFHYELQFTTPMNTTSVTDHGTMTVTTRGDVLFAGPLSDLPFTWDPLGTAVTLTPAGTPEPGTYALTLTLPIEVVSQEGLSVVGSPYTTTLAVAGAVGSAGGEVATGSGARLTVPPAALSADTPLEITATQVFSVPEGWVSGDGLAHAFGPEGQSFAAPVTLTLPISPLRAGAAIFRWSDDGWHNLGGWPGADGQSIYTTTTHLSSYAALWPVRYGVYLPLVLHSHYP